MSMDLCPSTFYACAVFRLTVERRLNAVFQRIPAGRIVASQQTQFCGEIFVMGSDATDLALRGVSARSHPGRFVPWLAHGGPPTTGMNCSSSRLAGPVENAARSVGTAVQGDCGLLRVVKGTLRWVCIATPGDEIGDHTSSGSRGGALSLQRGPGKTSRSVKCRNPRRAPARGRKVSDPSGSLRGRDH